MTHEDVMEKLKRERDAGGCDGKDEKRERDTGGRDGKDEKRERDT